MRERAGIYDPVILDILNEEVIKIEQERTPILMAIYELTPGMILAEDVLDGNGLSADCETSGNYRCSYYPPEELCKYGNGAGTY